MKMTTAILLTLGLLTFAVIKAEAANDPQALQKSVNSNFACADLQKASSKLPVYAKNIENKDTTRTPDGGSYKRVDITCHELFCETTAKADFKLMYAPKHPDANGAGYVQLPRIDVPSEFASLTSAAGEVRLLAENGTCGAAALTSPTMALIKYNSTSPYQSDTFNYGTDGRLSSWTRMMRDGTSKSYAFAADGTVISK